MSLLEKINKVKAFHETFQLDFHEIPTADIDSNIVALRHRLMQEENDEYLEACEKKDLTLIADALGDKINGILR